MLATHLGFFNTATTRTHVRFQFSTHAAAGGNVAPNSAFEAADLRIYRANDGAAFSATQRSSAAGITMTSPFDSLTGYHDVDIDLTDNTDAGFYASGYTYAVVLCPDETVDGQTLTGVVLAYFEIAVQPVNVTQFGGTAGTFASGIPAVNATQISGDSTAADNLETAFDDTAGTVPWLGIIDQGTAQSASATGLVLRAAAAFADDTLIGALLVVHGSTQGYWQSRTITDSALSGDSVTVDTWTVTPSGTITYKIFAMAPASGTALSGAQDSKLTKINSKATQIYSDSTAIHSDTTAVHSDTTAIHTQTTTASSKAVQIYSDTTIAVSKSTQIYSDTTAIHTQTTTASSKAVQIYSDTTIIYSDTTRIHSDTTAIHSDTTVIEAAGGGLTVAQASQLVRVNSKSTQIYSDTTAIHTQTTGTYSDTTIVTSKTTQIYSDTTAIHAQTTTASSKAVQIYSDTTAIHTQTTGTYSDTTIVTSKTTQIYSDTTAIHTQTTTASSKAVQIYSDSTRIHSDTTALETGVNVSRMNTVTVLGAGTSGDKWRGS